MAGVFLGLFECCDHLANGTLVGSEVAVLLQTDTYCADVLVCDLVYDRCVWTGDRRCIKRCPAYGS